MESGEFTIEIGRSSRDIALSAVVSVSSTTEIPVRFTVDSIFDDLMKSPKAMAKLAPLIDGVKESMGFGGNESEAASAAISNEMMEAMIRYMPLRTVASFSGGAMSYDQLNALVDAINRD